MRLIHKRENKYEGIVEWAGKQVAFSCCIDKGGEISDVESLDEEYEDNEDLIDYITDKVNDEVQSGGIE